MLFYLCNNVQKVTALTDLWVTYGHVYKTFSDQYHLLAVAPGTNQ